MTPEERMHRLDDLLSHVWMVRTFLKHSPEAESDDELSDVHRGLYDYMLALAGPLQAGDAVEYVATARKKLTKFNRAAQRFFDMQPDVSTHMNFQMAVHSLRTAIAEIRTLLAD